MTQNIRKMIEQEMDFRCSKEPEVQQIKTAYLVIVI